MAKPEEKTILVVDDEEDVRDYLSTVLDDAGFNVITGYLYPCLNHFRIQAGA